MSSGAARCASRPGLAEADDPECLVGRRVDVGDPGQFIASGRWSANVGSMPLSLTPSMVSSWPGKAAD